MVAEELVRRRKSSAQRDKMLGSARFVFWGFQRKFSSDLSTVIRDVATIGISGAGVFDANLKCLMGVMSRKSFIPPPKDSTAKPKNIAKYFVSAVTIAAFIRSQYRF